MNVLIPDMCFVSSRQKKSTTHFSRPPLASKPDGADPVCSGGQDMDSDEEGDLGSTHTHFAATLYHAAYTYILRGTTFGLLPYIAAQLYDPHTVHVRRLFDDTRTILRHHTPGTPPLPFAEHVPCRQQHTCAFPPSRPTHYPTATPTHDTHTAPHTHSLTTPAAATHAPSSHMPPVRDIYCPPPAL